MSRRTMSPNSIIQLMNNKWTKPSRSTSRRSGSASTSPKKKTPWHKKLFKRSSRPSRATPRLKRFKRKITDYKISKLINAYYNNKTNEIDRILSKLNTLEPINTRIEELYGRNLNNRGMKIRQYLLQRFSIVKRHMNAARRSQNYSNYMNLTGSSKNMARLTNGRVIYSSRFGPTSGWYKTYKQVHPRRRMPPNSNFRLTHPEISQLKKNPTPQRYRNILRNRT